MTNQEAIRRIKDHMDIHRMYEPKGTKISEALEMAIQALKREDKTRQMFEAEKNKAYCRSVDYRDGRISAFYDALGINYAD